MLGISFMICKIKLRMKVSITYSATFLISTLIWPTCVLRAEPPSNFYGAKENVRPLFENVRPLGVTRS